VKCNKSHFEFKNIIPLPISLLCTFITLPSTDPISVANAFISKLQDITENISNEMNCLTTTPDNHANETEPTKEDIDTTVTS
jgi:hypothetical protein